MDKFLEVATYKVFGVAPVWAIAAAIVLAIVAVILIRRV